MRETHAGEKPYSCSFCHQSFTWPKQLRNHQCDVCQSSQSHQTQTEESKEVEPLAKLNYIYDLQLEG